MEELIKKLVMGVVKEVVKEAVVVIIMGVTVVAMKVIVAIMVAVGFFEERLIKNSSIVLKDPFQQKFVELDPNLLILRKFHSLHCSSSVLSR